MASNVTSPSYFKLDKLVTDITECITSMSQEFSCMNIPVDDSCATFHRFCAKLEQFLSLGFKEKNLFGKRRSYWDYMLRCLASNKGGVHEGLKFVKNNSELKTSVGRGRAFLRFCLVHQCLADTLQQCVLGAGELTMEWYADWAPMKSEAALKLLITSLYDLNHVQFDLSSPSYHDLDLSWPSFNRKEFGSSFNWKAISRSGSISSLTSSLSTVDTFNNTRVMGAMGSVQEGSERNSVVDVDDGDEIGGEGGGTGGGAVGSELRGDSEEKEEEWWMSEDQGISERGDTSRGSAGADAHSWGDQRRRNVEMEEQLKRLKEWGRKEEEWGRKEEEWGRKEEEWGRKEEEWGRKQKEWERKEEEWRTKEGEWRSAVESWEAKERAWREEKEKMEEVCAGDVETFRESDEERRVEVDMLKARVLELEVVNTMAKWASVGVQATSEDEDSEMLKRIEAEEKLASVCRENEELKKALEQMRTSSKEDQDKCLTCELCSKQIELQVSGVNEGKPQPSASHEDDLRREYESQIRSVRELRGMYEERMKAAEEQSRKLREDLQDRTRCLELSRKRCTELRAHSQELEALLGEQESVARGLQTRLSASVEEGRALAAQLATVNKLFGRLGDTAELDFERLRLLQHSCEGAAGEDSVDCASGNHYSGDTENKVDANHGESREEVGELKEIAVSLPKVWGLLVELLGEEQKEEEKVNERVAETEGCFDSVPTPYGPRLVISVSRTFIRLKDLILEKKTLQNELGRIRDLNGRLESKLKQQERRLATVKVELKRTWGLVARMRAQHKQLHTSEQVLRYELQQKRKLLGELKQELEYCREKWELARLKNSQSEKEWQLLRQEFTARRSVDGDPIAESTEVNSPESGFSDGRGEDEEEDMEGGEDGEEDMEGGEDRDVLATVEYLKCSEDDSSEQGGDDCFNLQTDTSLPFDEENRTLPLSLDILNGQCNSNVVGSNLPECENESDASVEQSEIKFSNDVSHRVDNASLCPSEDCTHVSDAGSSEAPVAECATPPQGAVSAERSIEERLRARAERLRRLEEQCNLLFRKVTRTTTRSAELSSRLEELHEQYGEQLPMGEEGRQEGSILADTETGETPPDLVSASVSQLHPPPETPTQRPPTPPPLPETSMQQPPTPPPLPVFLPSIRLPTLIDHSSQDSSDSVSGFRMISLAEPATSPVLLSSNSLDLSSETQGERHTASNTVLEERNELADTYAVELSVNQIPENLSDEESGIPFPPEESNLFAEELSPASVTNENVSRDEVAGTNTLMLPPPSDLEELVEANDEQEEELSEEEIENFVALIEGDEVEVEMLSEDVTNEEMEGMGDGREAEPSVGLSREGSVPEEGEEIDAYIADMSSTIYGLHHGPLFDEGNTPSEEECGEDVVEEDDDETDEDSFNATSGSIGVASLLLQQLPKRMDILRRERHSLEQRLEEGEAALGRALAGTAAAERRACMLERGLAQAQERLRVLEMEAAVERNERLLEIKSALDVNPEDHASGSNMGNVQRDQSNAGRLQEEIDNLQQQTLAQIAGLQAAAVVSRAQKEQLSNLTDEVERQEKVVRCLEGELACLRREREEQGEALKDARGHLKDALEILAKKQEESEALQLQLEKLRMELDESNKENIGLFSRLAAAESEVTRLNGEIEQLKDDSDHLRDAVIRLTGEKEALYRANHNLEEMRRLVLEDSRWMLDRESETCTACGVTFSLMVRRHHCRCCGKIFCGACSSHWLALNSVSTSQSSSLVAGVVESLMGVAGAGKRSRACADCFAAYSGDSSVEGGETSGGATFSQGGMFNHKTDSSKSPESGSISLLEGPNDAGEAAGEGEGDDEDDVEDFSMISEEEVVLSQCTPYVPNPRTLQYWKSCEIQSGVMSMVPDLLAACAAEEGGKGKGEEVWVRAGAIYSVPLLIEDTRINILWEFSTNPNSIAFSVLYKSGADVPMSCALIVVPTTRVNSHLNPVHGRLRPKRAGVYVLMFDNSFSRFTGKTISYWLRAEVPSKGASGRESIASSSRSSVEPFPDLPVHPEGVEGDGSEHEDDAAADDADNEFETKQMEVADGEQ